MKQAIKEKLFKKLMTDGVLSTRENVMDEFTADKIENRMFVKKIPVEIPLNEANIDNVVKMVSVASDSEDFSDVDADNIRIGFENSRGMWSNLFVDEVSDAILLFIIDNIQ